MEALDGGGGVAQSGGVLLPNYYESLSSVVGRVLDPIVSSSTAPVININRNLSEPVMLVQEEGPHTVFNVSDNTTKEYIGVDTQPVFQYMYLVSITGYVINAMLFFTICCRQKFRRATNYLLANLCISSILFLFAVNLRIFERTHGPLWTYNQLNCIVWSVLRRIPQALASLTIVAISCDRSQAARILVNRPCSTDMTKKILRIWIIAVLTTLPRGFIYQFNPDMETSVLAYKCSPVAVGPNGIVNILYALFHMISIFMLPMCILVCDIYSTIQKIVFLKSRQAPCEHQVTHEQQNTQLHKKQLQLLRNSCIFAALFMVCWLPWGIYQQLGDLPESIVSPEFQQLIRVHFRTVRYLPFTVMAFLPLLLVVCTYDANTFSYWRKCFKSGDSTATHQGQNNRHNYPPGGRPPVRNHQGMELPNHRLRPLANNIRHHIIPPEDDLEMNLNQV